MQNINQPRIFILLGKKLNGEATVGELAELERLLEGRPVGPYELEMLQEIWNEKSGADEALVGEAWKKVSRHLHNEPKEAYSYIPKMENRKKVFSVRGTLAAASVASLLALTTWLVWNRQVEKRMLIAASEVKDSVVVAQNGERRKVQLPDNTIVYLNSGSRLSYDNTFGRNNREVLLSGEAFFDVAQDASHPFVVNTNRMMVKVLGTAFNVKAYDTKEDIETTVVQGKVEVSLKEEPEKKVILLPSEKVSLKNNAMIKEGGVAAKTPSRLSFKVTTVQPDIKETGVPEEAVWIKEKVFFTDEPFETVALRMERWYNVHIFFKNEKMKGILMSGDFDNVGIDEAMRVLQMMVGFNYTIRDKEITIE